jgi:hypothetical protein
MLSVARALAGPVRRVSRRSRVLAAAARTTMRRTDFSRWQRNASETPSWDERNVRIAALIPDNCSVLDLGAGAQTIRRYLKPNCRYQPCDLVKSSPDVLVCDFNRGRFPQLNGERFDYVICSGVLEYIRKPQDFLNRIRDYGTNFFITYNVRRDGDSILDRLAAGWVNHMILTELEELFYKSGLRCKTIFRYRIHEIIVHLERLVKNI